MISQVACNGLRQLRSCEVRPNQEILYLFLTLPAFLLAILLEKAFSSVQAPPEGLKKRRAAIAVAQGQTCLARTNLKLSLMS